MPSRSFSRSARVAWKDLGEQSARANMTSSCTNCARLRPAWERSGGSRTPSLSGCLLYTSPSPRD
eukprot:6584247-Alexandrium_andersonii.AAC.1